MCSRCKELDAENLSAASDEVHDVRSMILWSDAEHPLPRQGAIVKIVDATDFEATCIASRRGVGMEDAGHPCGQ